MDILADVLSNLRLRGELYFRTEFSGRWGVSLPADRAVIRFHLVVQGQCWVSVGEQSEGLLLTEGDFALIPHGAAQTLRSSADEKAVPLEQLLNAGQLTPGGLLRHGNDAANRQTRLVCGFFSFDEGLNHPLFHGLPEMLTFGRATMGSAPWLAEAVRVITMESELDAMGTPAVINRMMEILFIQGIRHYVESGVEPRVPYLGAIQDNRLHLAIEAMHRHPDRNWTLTGLAAVANMSRGRFAARFKETLGQSPMHYLANWRLQKARRLLKETDLSIAEVGFRSGYKSLPSFTRRFGKQFGISPGAFRKSS